MSGLFRQPPQPQQRLRRVVQQADTSQAVVLDLIDQTAVPFAPLTDLAEGISRWQEVGSLSANAAGSHPVAVANAPTTGNHLVAVIVSAANRTFTVTDSQSNSWTVHEAEGNSTLSIAIATCEVVNPLTTSDTITVTPSASQGVGVKIYEYDGGRASGWFDVSSGANDNTGGGVLVWNAGTTATPQSDAELALSVLATAATAGTITPDQTVTQIGTVAPLDFVRTAYIYESIIPGSTPQSWSGSYTSSRQNASAVLVFRRESVASLQDVTPPLIDRTGTAFSPTVTATANVSVALINQTGALFAPTITTGAAPVAVGLINQTGATFTPTVSATASVALGLINQTAAIFAPTVTPGVVTISLGLINQAGATFNPTITTGAVTVALALTDRTGATFAPTVSSLATIDLNRINQTAALFAPTTASTRDISLGLIDQTAATFVPTLSATADIALALTNQSAAAFTPTVNAGSVDVALGRIDQTAAAFAPTATSLATIAPALLDQTGVLFAPDVSSPGTTQDYTPALIDQSGVSFSPTISAQASIALGLIDQTGTTFAPTAAASHSLSVDLITQTGATFAPTVTTGLVAIFLDLINQAGATFAPSVSLEVVLDRITQTGVTFTPDVTATSAISLPLLSSTGATFAPTVAVEGVTQVTLDLIDATAQAFAPEVSGARRRTGQGGSWRGYALVEPRPVEEPSPVTQMIGLRVIAVNPRAFAPTVEVSDDEVVLGLSEEDLLVLV